MSLRPGIEEGARKKVRQPARAVRCSGDAMPGSGHEKKLEVLVDLDEGIDDLHRGRRVHIIVHFTDHQQQFALELVSVVHV